MRIERLSLYTAQLSATREFYQQTMGFELLEQSPEHLSFQVGDSILDFELKKKAPIYHFAMNIPAGQAEEGAEWLNARGIALLPMNGEKVVRFPDWNAHGVFFHDPNGNILELISRENMQLPPVKNFDAQAVTTISEIGLASADVMPHYVELARIGLDIYDGDPDRFCAVGDEEGLFILINNRIKKWIPLMEEAPSAPFYIVFRHQRQYEATFDGKRLDITESAGPA